MLPRVCVYVRVHVRVLVGVDNGIPAWRGVSGRALSRVLEGQGFASGDKGVSRRNQPIHISIPSGS